MNKRFNCIMCPMGCELEVEVVGEQINVSGNGCIRGQQYAKSELTCPVRSVSSLVKLKSGGVVAVKTSTSVPKSKIFDIMNELQKMELENRPEFHEVIIKNVCDTGADVICIE